MKGKSKTNLNYDWQKNLLPTLLSVIVNYEAMPSELKKYNTTTKERRKRKSCCFISYCLLPVIWLVPLSLMPPELTSLWLQSTVQLFNYFYLKTARYEQWLWVCWVGLWWHRWVSWMIPNCLIGTQRKGRNSYGSLFPHFTHSVVLKAKGAMAGLWVSSNPSN